jgi:glycosyltransferase involved in cell wall biosynthesis
VDAYTRELADALAAHGGGHEFVIVHPRAPSGARGAAVRVSRALEALAGVSLLRDPVSTQIDALGLDVVHYPATEMPQLRLKTPAVLTFFDMQEEFFPQFFSRPARLARRAARRAAVRRAAAVVAPSRFTAECLERRYDTPAAKVRRVPVGVAERFTPREGAVGEGRRVRDRYGIGPAEFLLYPAHTWPHKNHARLLRALRRLKEAGGSVPRLVCTGRLGLDGAALSSLVAAAGLSGDDVLDVGFVADEDVPALYRAALALVYPSLFEGFGMPVLEALACGCAVACSRIPPLVEIGGEAVCAFDPENESDLARALGAVAHEAALVERLRAAGPARAEPFRWARVVPELIEVYRAAATGRGPS